MGNEASTGYDERKHSRREHPESRKILESVGKSHNLTEQEKKDLDHDLKKRINVGEELKHEIENQNHSLHSNPDMQHAINVNISARTMIAKRGRKLFADFQESQAHFAKQWGESRGTEGVASLFEAEAPELAKKYGIINPEACGVTAVVCRGYCKETKVIVAIKFVRIHVQGLADKVRRQDCREEAHLQRLCANSNVVQLLDFELGPNFGIYVMEYITQSLLQNIVDRNSNGSYSETIAARYIKDIATALDACHKNMVVHMDVKLDNILCTDGNVAKLCDFGIAEQMKSPDHPIRRNVAAPLFAPPEVYTIGKCNTKADMWSLGVVLYILLCGYSPFKDTELKTRIMCARYTFPEKDWSHVSIMARDLISRLLVIDTSRRYSARQVLEHPWITALSELPRLAAVPPPLYRPSVEHAEDEVVALKNISEKETTTPAIEPKVAQVEADVEVEKKLPENVHVPPTSPREKIIQGADTSLEVAEEDTSQTPLPLRITTFLRNMHHYRELEKRGFENVRGGALYRAVLDGVDELTAKHSGDSSNNSPGWFMRRINHTLYESSRNDKLKNISTRAITDSSSELENGELTEDQWEKMVDAQNSLLPKIFEAFEPYYYRDEDAEYSSSVTISESYSIQKSEFDENVQQQDKPPVAEDTTSSQDTIPPIKKDESPTKTLAHQEISSIGDLQFECASMDASSDSRLQSGSTSDMDASRISRAKSYDIRPTAPPVWVADDEAVSCRVCDSEFGILNRRHHCRACGQVICVTCSVRRSLNILKRTNPVRVCKLCAHHKITYRSQPVSSDPGPHRVHGAVSQ